LKPKPEPTPQRRENEIGLSYKPACYRSPTCLLQ